MRKEEAANGVEHQPKYFQEYLDPESKEKGFKYVRDYWSDRESGKWDHLQSIF